MELEVILSCCDVFRVLMRMNGSNVRCSLYTVPVIGHAFPSPWLVCLWSRSRKPAGPRPLQA